MKKVQAINFLNENKKEKIYFIILVLILTFLLLFQEISYINSIKILEADIDKIKVSMNKSNISKAQLEKSTLMEDIGDVYELLGFSNVNSISIKSNEVNLEGQCDNLDVLDKLKTMNNVKDVSINSVERQDNKYLFKVTYHIGG